MALKEPNINNPRCNRGQSMPYEYQLRRGDISSTPGGGYINHSKWMIKPFQRRTWI
ncbi:MAG: hypothetical protein ABR974_12525 [Bacteroidales bacterium]